MRRFGLVLCLAGVMAAPALAHEPMGSPVKLGYVSTVSNIQPLVLGLEAKVLGGQDKLFVRNWSTKRVTLFERDGTPIVLKRGQARSWHDHRIGWFVPNPPKLVENEPDQPHLLRRWEVSGRAGTQPFVIKGLLGYAPPPQHTEEESNGWIVPVALIGGAAGLAAAVGAGAHRARQRAPKSP